jgi:wyosine [tRNA(Phe)-imidazoG37] synthetase (radical SAM superfamily)
MAFVFGPVPSRRLGRSLGVDPIPPKTCNWNCVYCQLGRTGPLVTERREFFPRAEILSEVLQALAGLAPGAVDWLTFVGSGETTLYEGLGWLIRQVKQHTRVPVAVITNGSLLYLPEVREELLAADAVLPTLDAGSERLYRRINRPSPLLDFERHVRGLAAFRAEYSGRLWVEVMLVQGLNDNEEALREIAGALDAIRPDCVHLSLPVRPPCEPWVKLADDAAVERALAILGAKARVLHPAEAELDLAGCEDPAQAIVQIVTRHPMGDEELRRALGRWKREEIEDALQRLRAGGQVQLVERHGALFWSAANYRYEFR